MNDTFRLHLDDFVGIYIDDIVVFSQTIDEHVRHLRQVLQLLRKNKLFGKMSKCEFGKEKMEFLRHVVSHDGIKIDLKKIQAVREWKTPETVTQV